MHNNPSDQDPYNIKALLQDYQKLQQGGKPVFLEEEAFERIIDYFDDLEEFSKALEAAETSITYFPYSSSLLLRKADVLISTQKYNDAMRVLAQVEALDANDINLYILKTDALLAMDRQEEAVRLLEEAVQHFDGADRIELLFELADVYDDYEEFDKVFDCLKLILTEDSVNEEALYKICFWTDFTGRNEESIRLHLQIIEEHPYCELAWFNLGAAYQGLKLYEKAIDAYKYVLAIDEKFDYAYRNMGDAYIRLRRFKDAIEALEKVLELSKPEEVIYEAIGHCYDRLKNFGQARFHYRKASHLSPEDAKLHYKIACTYFNEGAYASAVKVGENALRFNKTSTEVNLLLGESRMAMNQFKEAITHFSTVVRAKPRNKGGWQALIRCLLRMEYWQEAKQQSLVAWELSGHKPIFVYYLSAALLGMGKTKEGLLQLEKAIVEAPRLLNQFIALDPAVMQNRAVVDVIARNKRTKS